MAKTPKIQWRQSALKCRSLSLIVVPYFPHCGLLEGPCIFETTIQVSPSQTLDRAGGEPLRQTHLQALSITGQHAIASLEPSTSCMAFKHRILR